MKMKKTFLQILLLSFLVILAGCANSQSRVEVPSGDMENSEMSDRMDNMQMMGDEKIIEIEAYSYGFSPEVIEVNYGDRVTLKGRSRDVPHGISIDEFDVEMYVDGVEEDSTTFIADKRGEFEIYCSVYCGSGHSSMRAKLIVK